jgi:hypothetical protein
MVQRVAPFSGARWLVQRRCRDFARAGGDGRVRHGLRLFAYVVSLLRRVCPVGAPAMGCNRAGAVKLPNRDLQDRRRRAVFSLRRFRPVRHPVGVLSILRPHNKFATM